ncbi:MAG: SPOR domain-containing protein [Massilia sp.]|nr:SPOR domain-containing protein [Massilia sp.]
MLKLIFWSLLAVNGVLFAYSQGVLGSFKGNEREPARMKNQIGADKLTLISSASASAAASSAPAKAAPAVACIEIGNFAPAEAKRFEARLDALNLGERMARLAVPSTEISSHIVYIPSQGSKDAAEKKANELKNLGVTNYFIMSDNSPMKWGISLGVFKSEAAAQTLLAALNRQGVHSARIVGRGAPSNKLAYQFRDIDGEARAKIDDIASSFPVADSRSCK